MRVARNKLIRINQASKETMTIDFVYFFYHNTYSIMYNSLAKVESLQLYETETWNIISIAFSPFN